LVASTGTFPLRSPAACSADSAAAHGVASTTTPLGRTALPAIEALRGGV